MGRYSGKQIRQIPVPLVALALFGLPAFVVFSLWMLLTVGQFEDPLPTLTWRMWVAGTWFLLAPTLIVAWDLKFQSTLQCLNATSATDGWDVRSMNGRVRKASSFRRVTVVVTAVAIAGGFLGSATYLEGIFGSGSLTFAEMALSLLMTAWLGLTFGYGFWGVGTMLLLQQVALSNHSELKWEPFTSRQVAGLEALSQFAYVTGFLFSAGAVFLPAVLLILGEMPLAGLTVGLIVTGLLLLGGASCFLIPSIWIERVVRNQRNDCLDSLSPRLQGLLESAQLGQSLDANDVESLFTLRDHLLRTSAAPLAFQVGLRTASLLLLPFAIAIVAEVPTSF